MLFEGQGGGGTLNHLGVEVGSAEEVAQAASRLEAHGLEAAAEDGVDCCYAVQDKVWVDDPDGAPWEVYTVLAHSEVMSGCACSPGQLRGAGTVACCG